MTDDLTARARLRDATIALIAAGEKPTARSVAARANVSIGLIRHHFGTMEGLLLTCDEHVATLIRNAKNDAIRGPIPNVLETLRETGQDNGPSRRSWLPQLGAPRFECYPRRMASIHREST